MPMTPKQIVKYLEKNGFYAVRQPASSHLKMFNPVTEKNTTVPMHNNLGKGLEKAILKRVGL